MDDLPLILLPDTLYSAFNKYIRKGGVKKNIIWRDKSNIRIRLRYGTDLEFLDSELKISMINMLNALMKNLTISKDQMGI